jgi:hypothetical protein
VTGRTPWYLAPRSMGRWQSRLMSSVGPLVLCGMGFLFGWTLVRFPGRGDSANMPAPVWPFWLGLTAFVAGLLCAAVARLTSPACSGEEAAAKGRSAPANGDRIATLVGVAAFAAAMVICSAVSSSSAYRWRPIWTLIVMAICVPIAVRLARARQ